MTAPIRPLPRDLTERVRGAIEAGVKGRDEGDPIASDWMQRLVKSSFADSLYRLAGVVPDTIAPLQLKDRVTTAAAYDSPAKAQANGVSRTKSALRLPDDADGARTAAMRQYGGTPDARARFLLAHEMGHAARLDGSQRGAPFTWAPERAAGDPYYRANEDEGYAQAFARAVQVLQDTARDTTGGGEAMAKAERLAPGTSSVIARLLTSPVYAQHPYTRANLMKFAILRPGSR